MIELVKQILIVLFITSSLLSCNSSEELIYNLDSDNKPVETLKRARGRSVTDVLTFDSIEEADALLEAMLTIENSSQFYNQFILNGPINNKYINSLYEYMRIIEQIESGDSINAMSLFQQNANNLLNVYGEGSNMTVEPLALYDYRLLLNEDNYFIVDGRIYQLFDTLFITCPTEKHDELIEISQSPTELGRLITQLKTSPIPDSLGISRERNPYDDIYDLEYIYCYDQTSNIHNLKYEKVVNKHRMQVAIYADEHYVRFYKRHDLKTGYSIKNHTKWAGIWWIKNERINVDIYYIAQYARLFNTKTITIDSTYSIKKFYPSYAKVKNYPNTYLDINNYGISNVDFTISNQYMTITESNVRNN